MKKNTHTYTESMASEWVKDIEEAELQGEVLDYIFERAIDIERDSGGKPTKIIFTVGGPYVYLDLFCEPGYVKVFYDDKMAKAKLSNSTLEQIKFELEGLGYDS